MNNTNDAVNQIYERDDNSSDISIESELEGVSDGEIDDTEVDNVVGTWETRDMLFSAISVDMSNVDNKMLNQLKEEVRWMHSSLIYEYICTNW